MQSIIEFLKHLHDSKYLEHLVQTGGIPIVALVIFAETGLLVGFFLPGDTLLFLSGVVAGTAGMSGANYMNIWALTGALVVAAIVGDQLGYFLGYKTGHAIFTREEGFFFKRKRAEEAHALCLKYGAWAVVIAKFMPVFRTFVPFMAGVGVMPYPKYLLVDSLGVLFWINFVVWTGYLLGEVAQPYLHIILPGIAIVSMLPLIIGVVKEVFFSRKSTT